MYIKISIQFKISQFLFNYFNFQLFKCIRKPYFQYWIDIQNSLKVVKTGIRIYTR